MLRRSLTVAALAAAAVTLVPGAAAATPGAEPPQNTFRAYYSVAGQTELPDGRQAKFSLVERREASQDGWTADLYLDTWTNRDCGWWQCQDDYLVGHVVLDAGDVNFHRGLSGVSVTDVPVMLQSMVSTGPGGPTYTDVDEVDVSLEFVGSGEISRSVYHGDLCSDGQTACQAMRLESSRAASGTVSVDGQSAPTSTTIRYTQVAETAPKPSEESTQPEPPADGGEYPPPPPPGDSTEYPPPPSGDGSYPPPPGDGSYPPPPGDGSYTVPSGATADSGAPEVGATS